MASFRTRGESCTAEVRKKEKGKLVFSEYRTFTGPRAEKLARDWAARLEATIAEKGVPQRKLSAATLGSLLRSHGQVLESIKPLSRSRAGEIEQLAQEFDRTPLSAITSRLFTAFAQKRRAAGAGPATVLHNLSTIRSALGTAKPMHGYDVNADSVKEAIAALTKMKIVSRSRKRVRRPTAEELVALRREFDRISGNPSTMIPMAKIMDLAIELPRRVGELTEMLWTDYTGETVMLRDTKNPVEPRTETVPVFPAARAIIDSLPKIDERILPFNKESVTAAWKRACTRLGIEDLHFHDLRREGVSRLFERGLSIPEVALVSGHLDWSMLKIYTELRPQGVLEKFK